MATVRTYCRICEAACGLLAEVDGGTITRLRPDPDHPVSRGYACVKGPAMLEVHRDPDRLARPERRVGPPGEGAAWAPVPWDEALGEIGASLARIRAQHGPHAVAVYLGNPGAFGWEQAVFSIGFLSALGTRNFFNAGSLDCQNKFAVAERLYGSYLIQPVPDLDRTDLLLALGSNPVVSQMSFVNAPRVLERLRAIEARGGRVVWVNPRRTESARLVGEQRFIRPDTDAFLLLGLLKVILDEGRVREEGMARAEGVARLHAALAGLDLDRVACATGIARDEVVALARAFAAAPRAVAYLSTGVNQGSFGSAAFFAAQALNLLTGRLDAPGGSLVPSRALGLARLGRLLDAARTVGRSRVGGFTQEGTSLPTGLLADEILTPGEGQVRALVVLSGNPLLSAPGGARLQRALSSLELLVSIDLYRNETGALAHYTLPAADWLERADFPLAQVGMQPTPYVQLAPAVVAPRDERRTEGAILAELARRAGRSLFGVPGASHVVAWDPARLMPLVARLVGAPGRVGAPPRLLPEPGPGGFAPRTSSGLVPLDHPELLAEVARALRALSGAADSSRVDGLKLVSRRQRRSHNSWMHNVPRLADEEACRLFIHPDDAAARGVREGALVRVTSVVGTVTLPAALDPDLMPGTVSAPHGFGHGGGAGWRRAAAAPGVNVNLLAEDGPGALEPLSGMAHLSGISVEVTPASP